MITDAFQLWHAVEVKLISRRPTPQADGYAARLGPIALGDSTWLEVS